MKILAIDFGEKRVGFAFGESDLGVAFPLAIFDNNADLFAEIGNFIQEKELEQILIGLPYSLEGKETEQSQKTRDFGDKIIEKFKIPVEYFDERFSSQDAERKMKGTGKEDHDIAASCFLQTYLDQLNA